MSDEPGSGWTAEEEAALRTLGHEVAPPAALEERVAAALRREGVLRANPHRARLRLAFATAVGLALFASGLLLGLRGATRGLAPDARPRFVLLLYEDAAYAQAAPRAGGERVREYAEWARRTAQAGHLTAGEKLADQELWLGADGVPATRAAAPGRVTGFFILAAEDLEAALRLARGCPHLRHGGRIALRPIEPT